MHDSLTKRKAIELRKVGKSLDYISLLMKVPKSTLHGWFKDIVLTDQQKFWLKQASKLALNDARKKAVKWHNLQKKNRLDDAYKKAITTLERLDVRNEDTLKLSLSLLYLGEGSKRSCDTGMGNSDPVILRFFIATLKKLYGLSQDDFKCYLHLRADQSESELIKYWSHELDIPRTHFKKTLFDKRTIDKKTFDHYKGVCLVTVGKVAIQRELVFLSKLFCDKVSNRRGD